MSAQKPPECPVWTCEVCQEPIERRGALTFRYGEWEKFKQRERDMYRSAEHIGRALVVTIADLNDLPYPRWHATHDRCWREVGSVYAIDIERAQTWYDVAQWSAHLHGKCWFADSGWGQLLAAAKVYEVPA